MSPLGSRRGVAHLALPCGITAMASISTFTPLRGAALRTISPLGSRRGVAHLALPPWCAPAARRLHALEVLAEHRVEGVEVLHVAQEDAHLHDVGQRGARGLEHPGDVVEGHARLLGEVVGDDLPGDEIERALPRHEDEVAALHALRDRRLRALRESRLRRRLREDDFWFHADPPLSLRTTSSGIGFADSPP